QLILFPELPFYQQDTPKKKKLKRQNLDITRKSRFFGYKKTEIQFLSDFGFMLSFMGNNEMTIFAFTH
ncbi:hypothetical protein ACLI1Z_17490, partial [Enterococcus faecalis]|uniref:hypothetical protein n=1 Tax=Enterococcus faecalis TaxID=1351 RepID=UPI0039856703